MKTFLLVFSIIILVLQISYMKKKIGKQEDISNEKIEIINQCKNDMKELFEKIFNTITLCITFLFVIYYLLSAIYINNIVVYIFALVLIIDVLYSIDYAYKVIIKIIKKKKNSLFTKVIFLVSIFYNIYILILVIK